MARFVAGGDPYATLAELVARILPLTRDGELAASHRFARAVAAALRRQERASRPAPVSLRPRATRGQNYRDTPSS